MAEAPFTRRRQVRFWLGLAIMATGLLLVPAFFLSASSRLEAELARLRAEGVLRDIEDLAPRVPLGQKNAADLYRQAFTVLRLSSSDERTLFTAHDASHNSLWDQPFSQWDQARRDTARRVVDANQGLFAVATQAASFSTCAFPVDWGDPFQDHSGHLPDLQRAARLFALRARVLAEEGRRGTAEASLAASLQMAEHAAQEPTLMARVIAGPVMYGAIAQALEDVLSFGDPTPATCRQLFNLVTEADLPSAWRRGYQGELALTEARFDAVRRGTASPAALMALTHRDPSRPGQRPLVSAYVTVGRPMMDREELAYLRLAARAVQAADKPWPQVRREMIRVHTERGKLFRPRYVLSQSLLLGTDPLTVSRVTAEAQLGGAQIALALKAYKAEHGQYPTTLVALAQEGWKLPVDPFTGKPYVYQRTTPGFLVYSLGEDGKDQGGTAARPFQRVGDDVPFRCER